MDPVIFKLSIEKKSKVGSTSDLARVAAPKLAQILYNILRVGPRVILRSAFELLRANTITRILSAVVLVSIDTVSLIRGRISKKQYIINLILAVMLMVGGTAGWVLGSQAASLIVIENVALGIITGLAGAGILGAALAYSWEKFVKTFIKDDTASMLEICGRVFESMAHEYNLSEEEVYDAKELIKIYSPTMCDMYSQKDRVSFARRIIEPPILTVVNRRI